MRLSLHVMKGYTDVIECFGSDNTLAKRYILLYMEGKEVSKSVDEARNGFAKRCK